MTTTILSFGMSATRAAMSLSNPFPSRSSFPDRFALLAMVAVSTSAAVHVSAETIDYVDQVRPILQRHCYQCHGEQAQRSGLRLDIKSEAFKGGELFGPGIVPGQPDDSPIYQFVAADDADLVMPPDDPLLTAAEVQVLGDWIEQGAEWPDGVDLFELQDPADHWSFRPLGKVSPPPVADPSWVRTPVDRFVLARLESEGLAPSPEAGRVAWLRRVHFDLVGIPPTPQQVQAFVADQRPDAHLQLVERLLQSPRYGERWAQHWLDVVRYADTHGFEVNTERPHAWPYRDYVIQAFNEDKPYDQFIREQIAGDALQVDPATGFLVTASVLLPGQIGKDEASMRLARQDALDEIVANIGQSFLGLSITCARCHNHKFDPISQHDYYSLQAFVSGVEYADREFDDGDRETRRQQAEALRQTIAELNQQLAQQAPLAGAGSIRPMINARENVDRFQPVATRRLRFTIEQTNNLEPCIDELEVYSTGGENVALAEHGTTVRCSGDRVSQDRHELRFVNDGRYGNSSSWMCDEVGRGWVELEFPELTEIDRVVWGRDRQGKYDDRLAIRYRIEIEPPQVDGQQAAAWQLVADASDRQPYDPEHPRVDPYAGDRKTGAQADRLQRLQTERSERQQRLASLQQPRRVFAGKFRQPDEIRVLGRGSPELPKERVTPAVLSVLGDLSLPADADEQLRRQSLADWIADDENPLTARVMVNRIWQGHFGSALVKTPNDFGRNGLTPTHPELLDWLAAEFIRSGWSVKHLHRVIVLSATYRQASQHDAQATARDAEVDWLWRYPLRRLQGEAIRDAMLAISGQLTLTMGGPGFDLLDKRGGLSGFQPIERFRDDGLRRMIYAHKVRRERDAIFGAFDCPDGGQSAPQRRESTTAIQALNLFNSLFVIEQSSEFARSVIAQVGEDTAVQVNRVYQRALSRDPHPDEFAEARDVVEQHGLATLCRAIFNSNEFLFVP